MCACSFPDLETGLRSFYGKPCNIIHLPPPPTASIQPEILESGPSDIFHLASTDRDNNDCDDDDDNIYSTRPSFFYTALSPVECQLINSLVAARLANMLVQPACVAFFNRSVK